MGIKNLIAVAATLCASVTAVDAATSFDVTQVHLYAPFVVNLDGPGIHEQVEDSVLLFTKSSGATKPYFCVDIWHPMPLGNVHIVYDPKPLLTNSSGVFSGTGTPLSETQIGEIGGLVVLGNNLYSHSNVFLAADMAGIQAAIWAIENPEVTVSGDTQLNGLIATYESYASAHPSYAITAYYDVRGAAQGVAGPVPEPAAWLLMLTGFAGLGASVRAARRREKAA